MKNKTQTHNPDSLTKEEFYILREVTLGGDVYDRGIAVKLRALEKRGFVTICEPADPPSGEKQQPYFGAITTMAGRAAIAKAEGRVS